MSAPKYVEDTFRGILIEELRKKQVQGAGPVAYSTEAGRLIPDAVLEDGGTYLVEAKLGRHNREEEKLAEALGDLHDYTKYIPCTGAFAVVYPSILGKIMSLEKMRELVFDPNSEYRATAVFNDARPTDRKYGSFSELLEWISRHVLEKPMQISVDEDFLVRMLQHQVEYLTASFSHLTAKELEAFFGGKDVFHNILQYETGKYPVSDMRRAAAYLLINQLLFYHVLSKADSKSFPPVDEQKLRRPSDVNFYFAKALSRDYTAVFGFDVTSRLKLKTLPSLRKVSKGAKALGLEKIGQDILGKVFHNLIPLQTRKKVAAYYTNNNAAVLLASLCIEDSNDLVMDPACGSGTLLVSSYRRKKLLLENSGKLFGIIDHQRFLQHDLTGIDIMPFASHLAVIHLSLQAPLFETKKVRVAVWDSTELSPGQKIPALSKELRDVYKRVTLDTLLERETPLGQEELYVTKGAVGLDTVGVGEEIPLTDQDTVIMNPPFTRQESLPTEYKSALDERFQKYSKYSHGQIGLHGYFMFLADSFLKRGKGRLALVQPATILRLKSTEGLREFLADNYDVEYIITAWQKLAFSESAWIREILLVGKKRQRPSVKSNEMCAIVTLKKLPKNADESEKCGAELRQARVAGIPNSEWATYKYASQQELASKSGNWFDYIALYDPRTTQSWINFSKQFKQFLRPVSDFLELSKAKVIRGIETRDTERLRVQDMYLLRDESHAIRPSEKWIIKEETRTKIVAVNRFDSSITMHVPKSALEPAIRSQSGLDTMDLSPHFDYVVVEPFEGIEEMLPEVPKKELSTFMSDWSEYVRKRLSNLLVSRRFVLGVPGTFHLCYYSDKPFAGPGIAWQMAHVPEEEGKIVTLWMNSSFNLAQTLVNKIHDVWIDFHKYVLLGNLILDPFKLSGESKKRLLAVFEELRLARFENLSDQFFRRSLLREKIDRSILQSLGASTPDIERLLEQLYPALSEEIHRIQDLLPGTGEIAELGEDPSLADLGD